MFAILFGLSMDYEVFLLSRVHEEWLRTRDNARSVRIGLSATGSVITAAAAVMITVFGSFIIGGQRVTQEFGIGLAAAVLLDAVVIRSALVPAVMQLPGRANWYLPGWLRWLPRLHLEAPAADPVGVVEPGPPRPDREPGLVVAGRLRGSATGIARGVLTLVGSGGAEIDRARTGANGVYRLTARAPGTYLLVASAAQHRPAALPITLNGHPLQLDITLIPQSASGVVVRRRDAGGSPREMVAFR